MSDDPKELPPLSIPVSPERPYGRFKSAEARDRALAQLRQWNPGESGNPNGKPRSDDGLARAIRRKFKDGQTLVDLAAKLLADEAVHPKLKVDLFKVLAQQGWAHPAVQKPKKKEDPEEEKKDPTDLSEEDLDKALSQ